MCTLGSLVDLCTNEDLSNSCYLSQLQLKVESLDLCTCTFGGGGGVVGGQGYSSTCSVVKGQAPK